MADTSNVFGWPDRCWAFISQVDNLFDLPVNVITLTLFIVALTRRDDIRRWLTRNSFPSVGHVLSDKQRWNAIVFTLSRIDLPLWVMRTYKPSIVGFIATDYSVPVAQRLVSEAERLGIEVVGREHILNPNDPSQTREAASRLLNKLKARKIASVAVDVTGGTTPMSLGAFVSAEENGVTTLYITAKYKNNKPIARSVKLIAVSQPQRVS